MVGFWINKGGVNSTGQVTVTKRDILDQVFLVYTSRSPYDPEGSLDNLIIVFHTEGLGESYSVVQNSLFVKDHKVGGIRKIKYGVELGSFWSVEVDRVTQ